MTNHVAVEHNWNAEMWGWPLQHDGITKVINTKDKFQVGLEVPHYKPDEIEVKAADQELFVNCSHEERSDWYGKVTRAVQRAYHLPEDVDETSITTNLTPKGVLIVTADKKK